MSSTRTVRPALIAVVGFIAALVGLLMVCGAGPAYRFQLVGLGGAFGMLRWGAWIGLGAIIVALIGAWTTRPGTARRGFVLTLAGLVIGAIAFGVPFAMLQNARKLPPIHDITTDTENPPPFAAIVPLRKGSPNPVDYAGAKIAEQQHAAYPDIQPAALAEPPHVVVKRALNVAQNLGWQIVDVATTPDGGRIEATDTTMWFGFEDDIVVRVTPAGGGSRIDVRSVSRLGQGDVGKNAARIRSFLQRLKE